MPIERIVNGVIHEFPDGTPESKIQEELGITHTTNPAPTHGRAPAKRTEAVLPNALGSALQGLSMGFSDEAIAKLRSLGEKDPQAYERFLQAERQGLREYSQKNPITSGVSEFGGALVPSAIAALSGVGAPAGAANMAGIAARVAPGLLRSLAKPALYGAAQGAVSGVGSSEKKGIDFGDAASGAVVGGGLGATGVLAGKALKSGWGAIKNNFGFGNPNHPANLAIAEALKKDGFDPKHTQNIIDELGNGHLTLADLGENTRNLLAKATQAPGETRNKSLALLADRAADRVPRVGDDLQSLMSGSKDFYTDFANLKNARSQKAQALYDDAYSQPLPDKFPKIFNVLRQDKNFTDAQRQAYNLLAATRTAEGKKTPLHPELIPNATTKDYNAYNKFVTENQLALLHYTKLALDDKVGEIKASNNGLQNTTSRAMTGIKNKLLEAMDEISPHYKLARKTFSGDSALMNAMNDGKAAYTLRPEQLNEAIAEHSLNPSELDAFRAGLAQSMKERLEKSKNPRPIRDVLGSKDVEDRLKGAFQDDASFEEFKKRLLAEERAQLTEKQVMGTKAVEPGEGGADLLGAAKTALTSPTGALGKIAAGTMARAQGMAPAVAAPTAAKLLTPASSGLDPVLQSIMSSLKQEEMSMTRGVTGNNILGGGIGGNMANTPPSMSGGAQEPAPAPAPMPVPQGGLSRANIAPEQTAFNTPSVIPPLPGGLGSGASGNPTQDNQNQQLANQQLQDQFANLNLAG